MRVLYLSPRFPWPLDRGDRMTGYSLLRVLARDHAVTLLSCVDGREPPDALERLRSLGIRVETVGISRTRSWLQAWLGLASRLPSQVAYYRSSALRARAEQLLAEAPDAVFVQMFRVAPAVAGLEHPAKVLFLGDSLAMNMARGRSHQPWWKLPLLDWERRRVADYEVECTHEYSESWVVSPVDLEVLAQRGACRVRLVPHGVDERLFTVRPARAPEPRLMFLGNLSVSHNVDAARFAAREVLPRVRAKRPDATLWLAGASPAREVRELAALPGVTVTGTLPSLLPVWAAAHVLVAPLRFSSGIQNKVLEAMASGVPVVTTSSVAKSLDGGAEFVRVADSADALAAQVLALLAEPAVAAALARRAREHAREHFSWEALGRELERVAGERTERVRAAHGR